jgi:hypothetical protein
VTPVPTILTILTEIDRLTKEQGSLVALDDKAALEENLEKKEFFITSLREMPQTALDDECLALLESIAAMERENVRLAKDEMERLKDLMKKTKEGMTTVRGYDAFSSAVGATYIDKKK